MNCKYQILLEELDLTHGFREIKKKNDWILIS
jgi:hypothetical protein